MWPYAGKTVRPRSAGAFRAGETQILTSGVPFSVALRSKKRGGQKKAPRSKRLYPYRKNPSVRHTVWGNIWQKHISNNYQCNIIFFYIFIFLKYSAIFYFKIWRGRGKKDSFEEM